MTDILERLRATLRGEPASDHADSYLLWAQAADEIERLRARLAEAERAVRAMHEDELRGGGLLDEEQDIIERIVRAADKGEVQRG